MSSPTVPDAELSRARVAAAFEAVRNFLAMMGLDIITGSEITKAIEIVERWHDIRPALLHIVAAAFLALAVLVVQYLFALSFRRNVRVIVRGTLLDRGFVVGVLVVLCFVTQLAVALTFISGFYDVGLLGTAFVKLTT